MIIYLDRAEVPDLEHIPGQVLQHLISASEQANGRYDKLHRYYLGRHDNTKKPLDEGESVVTINYAKYITDIILGYYLGEPVKYDTNPQKDKSVAAAGTDEAAGVLPADNEPVDISALQDAYDAQQIATIDADIGKYMGIMGDCMELCYASDDEVPMPRSAYIDPRNGVLVCDTSVEHKKLFGVVWDKRQTVAGQTYYAVSIYTDTGVQELRCDDLSTAAFTPVADRREHYFGAVPLIAYTNNRERQGDFEQIISLIDAYDELMSNRLTDKKKFVDALLVFFGMTLRDGDDEKLAREKFLDGAPLDARAEYIQKTFDESSVQVLADALVREMHKITMTVDMSDEQFAGNSSGQALKLKLLTMNLLAKNKMRRMEKGLKERFSLYNHWLVTRGDMAPVGVNDIDVVFTLSMPINESEIVQMVTSLQGIVDDQTLLSQLWFVRDPAEAAENIRRQKQANAAIYGVPPQADEAGAEEDAKKVLKQDE